MTDSKLWTLLNWCQTVGISIDSRLQLRFATDPPGWPVEEEQDDAIGVLNLSNEFIDSHVTRKDPFFFVIC